MGEPTSSRPIDVVVSRSPQHTLFSRVSAAARRRGADFAGLGPEQAFAMSPLSGPRSVTHVPNATVPIVDRSDVTVEEQIEALREGSEVDVAADLAYVAQLNDQWAAAANEPGRWLRGYAGLTTSSWRRLEPTWRAARRHLDRETERIGVAAVRDGLDALLNTLSPRLSFADGVFRIDDRCVHVLGGRRLILVPGLAPVGSLLIHYDQPSVMSIAYPMPNRAHEFGTRTGRDRLVQVLGAPRATILRAVTTPQPMGGLAQLIAASPAAVTWHCDQLEKAGLIVRERCGKSVHAARTEDGALLVDRLG